MIDDVIRNSTGEDAAFAFHLITYSEAVNDRVDFPPSQYSATRKPQYNRIIIKTSFKQCGCVVTTKLRYNILKEVGKSLIKEWIEDQHFTIHPIGDALPQCESCGVEPVTAGSDLCVQCSGGVTAAVRIRRFLIYRNVSTKDSFLEPEEE